MATISIWGRYQGKIEKLDSATSPRDAAYLVGEYRMAFGHGWQIWAGRRDENPHREAEREQVRHNWAALGIGN